MDLNETQQEILKQGAVAGIGVTLLTGDPVMGAIAAVGQGMMMDRAYGAACDEILKIQQEEADRARSIAVSEV